MSAGTKYTLSAKLKKMLENRGFKLVCKLCEHPLQVGEKVESHPQKRGLIKLYHQKCIEDAQIDSPEE
jgi:hypothetical protein